MLNKIKIVRSIENNKSYILFHDKYIYEILKNNIEYIDEYILNDNYILYFDKNNKELYLILKNLERLLKINKINEK